jgi:hypothetical protein
MFAATVFNIVVTMICFTLLLLLYSILLVPHIPAERAFIAFPFLFVIAVILSFLVYQRVLKVYLKKKPFKEYQ